jgi:hypothetical protein
VPNLNNLALGSLAATITLIAPIARVRVVNRRVMETSTGRVMMALPEVRVGTPIVHQVTANL